MTPHVPRGTSVPYFKPGAFTAHKVIRAMTKTCATHEIGADGFALVALIAHQWDAIRYRAPVSYHLGTLMHLLGITSKHSLYRIERRCIEAGWLLKKNQGTRMPVLYTVEIPDEFRDVEDGATEDGPETSDETPTNPDTNPSTNSAPNVDTNSDTHSDTHPAPKATLIRHPNGTQTDTPISLSLFPLPLPPPPAEPGLAAVAAVGGYLTLDRDGTDLRPRWREALDGLTPERVAEVMTYGRARRGEPVRVPYGDRSFHAFRLELDKHEAALRKALDDADTDEAERRAATASARLLAYVRRLEPEQLDRIGAEVARSATPIPATAALRRAAEGKGLTAMLVDTLRKCSRTLDAVANGNDPEATP